MFERNGISSKLLIQKRTYKFQNNSNKKKSCIIKVMNVMILWKNLDDKVAVDSVNNWLRVFC